MATEYTIQVDMEGIDGDWLPMHRLPDVTDERDAGALADWAADRYVVADGADWRIRVWHGHHADEGAEPACHLLVSAYET